MNSFYKWFLKLITPITRFLGNVSMPWSIKKITGDDYYKWRDDIKPGDVILSSTYGAFSFLMNPSEIKHGAIYTGGDKIKYVMEALGRGATKNNLVTHLTTKDVIIILTPRFANPEQIKLACEAAIGFEGRPYDFIFDNKSDNKLYCFELIAKAYNDPMPEVIFKEKQIVKGKRIYDHDTFLKDPERWEVKIKSI